jgi:hypothetical protein
VAEDTNAQRSPAIFLGLIVNLAGENKLDKAHFQLLLYKNSDDSEEELVCFKNILLRLAMDDLFKGADDPLAGRSLTDVLSEVLTLHAYAWPSRDGLSLSARFLLRQLLPKNFLILGKVVQMLEVLIEQDKTFSVANFLWCLCDPMRHFMENSAQEEDCTLLNELCGSVLLNRELGEAWRPLFADRVSCSATSSVTSSAAFFKSGQQSALVGGVEAPVIKPKRLPMSDYDDAHSKARRISG